MIIQECKLYPKFSTHHPLVRTILDLGPETTDLWSRGEWSTRYNPFITPEKLKVEEVLILHLSRMEYYITTHLTYPFYIRFTNRKRYYRYPKGSERSVSYTCTFPFFQILRTPGFLSFLGVHRSRPLLTPYRYPYHDPPVQV